MHYQSNGEETDNTAATVQVQMKTLGHVRVAIETDFRVNPTMEICVA